MKDEMDGNDKIPVPISFNASKHHMGTILEILNGSDKMAVRSLESICHNYSDIYTGNLSLYKISENVLLLLKNDGISDKQKFTEWLSGKTLHRKIALPDQSEWILRLATDPDRFVHIHPARTGQFSIRFKGSTLKTVYRLTQIPGIQNGNPSLERVNTARKIVDLSPVNRLYSEKGILKCWKYFLHIF